MMQFGVGGGTLPMPCSLKWEGRGLWRRAFCQGMGVHTSQEMQIGAGPGLRW